MTAEQKKDVEEMQRNMLKRKAQLHEIEQTLPQKNSTYLKVSGEKVDTFKWVIQRQVGLLVMDTLCCVH